MGKLPLANPNTKASVTFAFWYKISEGSSLKKTLCILYQTCIQSKLLGFTLYFVNAHNTENTTFDKIAAKLYNF